MPPNENCVTWWLEIDTESGVDGELWVNGHCIGALDDTSRDITHAVAVGYNTITVRLVSGELNAYSIACVPYPCL